MQSAGIYSHLLALTSRASPKPETPDTDVGTKLALPHLALAPEHRRWARSTGKAGLSGEVVKGM